MEESALTQSMFCYVSPPWAAERQNTIMSTTVHPFSFRDIDMGVKFLISTEGVVVTLWAKAFKHKAYFTSLDSKTRPFLKMRYDIFGLT